MKLLLGITGSVAAKLSLKMINELKKKDINVHVVATKSSLYFWNHEKANIPVYLEEDEWPSDMYDNNAPIKHIELREWADAMLIAPLTAQTLSKIANGMADNLLTSVIRAWDKKKPIVIAPAMNTLMWNHPVTKEHIDKLKSWFMVKVIPPISKTLACGDEGVGAMANIDEIALKVKNYFEEKMIILKNNYPRYIEIECPYCEYIQSINHLNLKFSPLSIKCKFCKKIVAIEKNIIPNKWDEILYEKYSSIW